MSDSAKYVANLQRVGAAYDESMTVLSILHAMGDWRKARTRAGRQNILRKRSDYWKEDLLRATKRRYVNNHKPLPAVRTLSRFVVSDAPRQSKIQTLFQYVCEEDALVDRVLRGLLWKRATERGSVRLTRDLFDEFIEEEKRDHPELREWSPSVQSKWRRSFFALLRATRLMESAPSVTVRPLVVREDAAMFLIHGLVDAGLTSWGVLQHRSWTRYLLDERGREEIVAALQEKGWIRYRRAGEITELETTYPSLEDWIHVALE